MTDWYEHRNELESGRIFRMHDGSAIKLDHMVAGDGSAWYVADWLSGSWAHMDRRIEPCDLLEPVAEQYASVMGMTT